MRQMKRRNLVGLASIIGAGAMGSVQTAQADVFYTDSSTSSEKGLSQAETGNQASQAYEELSNFQAQLFQEFTWIKPSEMKGGNPTEELQRLQQLMPAFRRIDELRAEMRAIVKQARQSDTEVKNYTLINGNLDTLEANMKELNTTVNEMKNTLANISTVTMDTGLVSLVNDARQVIRDAQLIGTHYEDGILGNLDKVHRKSYDSGQLGVVNSRKSGAKTGVIVDTSDTQRTNVVTSEIEQLEDKVVHDASEVSSAREEILLAIHAANKKQEQEVLRADSYKDNALFNIDNINYFLQQAQDMVDDTNDEAAANETASANMESFKSDMNSALNALKEKVASTETTGDKNAVLNSLSQAQNTTTSSSVTVTYSTIDTATGVDFGDIGRPVGEVQGIINSTMGALSSQIGGAMSRLIATNAAANQQINQARSETAKAINDLNTKFDGFVKDQKVYDEKKAEADKKKAEAVKEWSSAMKKRGLTPTGDYEKDRATIEKWNETKSSGVPGHSSGIRATEHTSYSGGAGTSPYTLGGGIIEYALGKTTKGQNLDYTFDPNRTFVIDPRAGGEVTIKGTTNGNIKVKIDNVQCAYPGFDDMTVLTMFDKPDGGFGMAILQLHHGILTGGNVGESASGGGNIAATEWSTTHVRQYNATIETEAENVGSFTLNDIDASQNITFKGNSLDNSSIETGSGVSSSGGRYSSNTSGDVSEGSTGELSSGSMAIDYDEPKKVKVSYTHRTEGENTSIVAGIFGNSSDRTPPPIDIPEVPPVPDPPTPPTIQVQPVSTTVESFHVTDPSAVAHSEGQYHVKKVTGGLKPVIPETDVINIKPKEIRINIPKIIEPQIKEPQRGASATSIVVRKLNDETKRGGYGNSLVVRTLNETKRGGYGNSLVVRKLSDETKRGGYGNSLVVRKLSDEVKRGGYGNSLVVRVIRNQNNQQTASRVIESVAQGNANGVKPVDSPLKVNRQTVYLPIRVDASLRSATKVALTDWAKALAQQGISLKVTTSPNAKIAILDSDNVTTKAAQTTPSYRVADDKAFEMSGLAGLTTSMTEVGIAPLDQNDKLNKLGTFRVSDLAKTSVVVQINTEVAKTPQAIANVIKHEFGHVFGLAHDDEDPLMTVYFDDQRFTGKIQPATAAKVAENLRRTELVENRWV